MNAVDTSLTGKGAVKLISGNHACALGAVATGCRFFAGYPITPSSEIAERLSRRLPEVGGVFVQMEDEIASMAAVIGASMGGVKAMTATSGPGFSLKQENQATLPAPKSLASSSMSCAAALPPACQRGPRRPT